MTRYRRDLTPLASRWFYLLLSGSLTIIFFDTLISIRVPHLCTLCYIHIHIYIMYLDDSFSIIIIMFSSVVSWRFISLAAITIFYSFFFLFWLLFFSKQFAQVQLPLVFCFWFLLLIGSQKKRPKMQDLHSLLFSFCPFPFFFCGWMVLGVSRWHLKRLRAGERSSGHSPKAKKPTREAFCWLWRWRF